jgi:Domain of unknown function (DUF4156)
MRGATLALAGGLLLSVAACEPAELTAAGTRVQTVGQESSGCRLVGTVRQREGGGLRSLEENRAIVDNRMRNEAARLGGNALAVIEVANGDSDEGELYFATGVTGLSTPNVRCTNCILVTARVLQCDGLAPAIAPAPTPPPLPGMEECVPARGPALPPGAAAPALPPAQTDD